MIEAFKALVQEEIDTVRAELAAKDPALAKANGVTPPFSWWTKGKGFRGLVSLIVEQQVSVTSAKAIFKRLEDGIGGIHVETILAHDIQQLRSFGLSLPKAKYILGIAKAHADGDVVLAELESLDDEAACAKLVELKGVGRWTAEAYLMGCEGRTDVFPAADVALQEALRILDASPCRLSTEGMYERAERWRPNRAIAAQLLWGYYGAIKGNVIPMPQGVPPMIKTPSSAKSVNRRKPAA